MFVQSQTPSSKGLVPVEEVPVEKGSMTLPARYPGELTWNEEVRLLFPVFLRVNPKTYFFSDNGERIIVPYVTLMQASKHNPFLFMSLVLQRAYDRLMRWPTRADAVDPNYHTNWKTCNLVKFPPLRQVYPVDQAELARLRNLVSKQYVPSSNGAMLDYLPDSLTPTEREVLMTCDQIDAQFAADTKIFRRHLL